MTIFSLLFLLLSSAVTFRREKSIQYSKTTIIFLLSCFIIIFKHLNLKYLDESLGLYNGLFNSTSVSSVFQTFIYSITAVILLLNAFYPRKVWLNISSVNKYTKKSNLIHLIISKLWSAMYIANRMGSQYRIIEYPLIIIFIIIGANFLISSGDIVSIFLSIELQSYGLYILCTLYRDSEPSTSGGLIYFLLGGLSSCFILLGISLLYTNSGTTNLDEHYIITGLFNVEGLDQKMENILLLYYYTYYYLNVSLLIMSVGLLFKVSAAPFHFWSPDVYDAIPTVVTTFVAIMAKISILVFFIELVHFTSNFYLISSFNWTYGLLFSCLMSFIIGTVLGLSQFRIKRLLAYSTISHLGFMLLGLSVNNIESIQAFMFYLLQYSISNLNAFILLISAGYILFLYAYKNNSTLKKEYDSLLDKNNSPIQLLNQIRGYFNINTVLALSFAITLFSFIGIPPLLGFFAKQMILSAALDNGYIFLSLVAILTSVISASYYLELIKQMFFDSNEYRLNKTVISVILKNIFTSNFNSDKYLYIDNVNIRYVTNVNLSLSSSLSIIISILTLIILLFLLEQGDMLSTTNILSLIVFNP